MGCGREHEDGADAGLGTRDNRAGWADSAAKASWWAVRQMRPHSRCRHTATGLVEAEHGAGWSRGRSNKYRQPCVCVSGTRVQAQLWSGIDAMSIHLLSACQEGKETGLRS